MADAVLGLAKPSVVKTSTECVPATDKPMVQMISVAVHLETKQAAEPTSTELFADDVPKPFPMTVNVLPKATLVGFTEKMVGVKATLELYTKRNGVVTENMISLVVALVRETIKVWLPKFDCVATISLVGSAVITIAFLFPIETMLRVGFSEKPLPVMTKS